MSYKIRKIWNYNRLEKNFVVGDLVKISFEDPSVKIGGESMWVEITEAKGYQPEEKWENGKGVHEETFNTEFKGTLGNIPVYLTNVELDQEIEFSLEHIIN